MRQKKCGVCQYFNFLQKNKKSKIGNFVCSLCNNYSLGSSSYVILLGFIGTVITAVDIIRIVKCQIPERYNIRQRPENAVPHIVERDLKLMTSVLGIEHYTQIMLGAITVGVPDATYALASHAILCDNRRNLCLFISISI